MEKGICFTNIVIVKTIIAKSITSKENTGLVTVFTTTRTLFTIY